MILLAISAIHRAANILGSARRDKAAVSLPDELIAADEDSATGGPDPVRGIYPILAVITEDGFRQLTDDESGQVFAELRAELGRGETRS